MVRAAFSMSRIMISLDWSQILSDLIFLIWFFFLFLARDTLWKVSVLFCSKFGKSWFCVVYRPDINSSQTSLQILPYWQGWFCRDCCLTVRYSVPFGSLFPLPWSWRPAQHWWHSWRWFQGMGCRADQHIPGKNKSSTLIINMNYSSFTTAISQSWKAM